MSRLSVSSIYSRAGSMSASRKVSSTIAPM
jgi:hypothetical protein